MFYISDICSPVSYARCKRYGFEWTYYPTWFAENETANVAAFEKWAMPAVQSGCHVQAEFFMCAMFFPKCNEDAKAVTLPCRTLCLGGYSSLCVLQAFVSESENG
jgi:hypothetical protein